MRILPICARQRRSRWWCIWWWWWCRWCPRRHAHALALAPPPAPTHPFRAKDRHFNLCSMRCTSCFLILNKWNGTEHGYQHQHTHTYTHAHAHARGVREVLIISIEFYQASGTNIDTHTYRKNFYIYISRCIYTGFLYNVMYIIYIMNVIFPFPPSKIETCFIKKEQIKLSKWKIKFLERYKTFIAPPPRHAPPSQVVC